MLQAEPTISHWDHDLPPHILSAANVLSPRKGKALRHHPNYSLLVVAPPHSRGPDASTPPNSYTTTLTRKNATNEPTMAAVTIKTAITAQTGPFGVVTYGTARSRPPSHRIAVPLTTVWSLPAGCTEIGDVSGTCAPPDLVGVHVYDGYYSPGVCYSGYTIGCTATATSVNLEPVKPSETVAFCVPR
jgi:hypothetical protein